MREVVHAIIVETGDCESTEAALKSFRIAEDALDECDRLWSALEGMIKHSCVADADWDDKDIEDHAYESAALKALGKPNGG